MILIYSLLSASLISLTALVGLLFVNLSEKRLKQIIYFLVAIAAGFLMAGGFIHILPEASEKIGSIEKTAWFVFIGFALFFLMERLIHWRHCHEGDCSTHPVGYLSLIGNGIHHLIDGIIISGAFLVSFRIGVLTSILIVLHEIPQELGNYGVLVNSGIAPKKSVVFNWLASSFLIVGALLGYLMFISINQFVPYILAIAGGGFIYISASDLIPEFHKEKDNLKAFGSFILFCLSVVFMGGLRHLMHS